MNKIITYKNFLEAQAYKFGMDWEERRKYIKELMDITDRKKIKFIDPCKEDK